MKTQLDLAPFRFNKNSQFGEDGIIEKLFELLKIDSGHLVEFGCWDSVHLSNTRHHFEKNPLFKKVLIEQDKERFGELIKNVPWTNDNILLNLEVEKHGENSLNYIFSKYKVDNIALLSIDVDGRDIDLFETLDVTVYCPAIVIIEEGRWQQPEMLDGLVDIFDKKGYNLVHVTGNFIFVDAKYKIKAVENIHQLIRLSGNDEYIGYFGENKTEQIVEIE